MRGTLYVIDYFTLLRHVAKEIYVYSIRVYLGSDYDIGHENGRVRII